jgi:large subunit ribosomal protein L19
MKAQGYTNETIKHLGVAKRVIPFFSIGDTIVVHQRIKEGGKERIQTFQGDVICIHARGNGASATFTVRKLGANAVAVERIFPYHTPIIAKIELLKRGKIRRAKLYYLRDRVGKAARVTEDRVNKDYDGRTTGELEAVAADVTSEAE